MPPGLHLVFDGRLDNRPELLHALGHDHPRGRVLSDAHLVLLAYQHWAEDCFARFLGPFALALYDAGRHRVVCARDPLGDRTLFYHLNTQCLLVASEEQAILTHPTLSATLHPPRLAAYFACQVPADGSTFFTAVHELLPAHAMMIEVDASRTWRYWHIDPGVTIRYRTEAEYADHFRSLLDHSVACRLRSVSTPAVMMSGGLDSTAIAAVAARQLRHLSPAQSLPTLSFVFDTFKSCDERWFMEAILAHYPLQGTQILGDDAWPLNHIDTWPLIPNSPENDVYRHLQTRLYQRAHETSHRVVLSGEGGDQLYMGAESWLLDLLSERQFGRAVRDSFLHIRHEGLLPFIRRTGLSRWLGGRWLRRLWTKAPLPWLTPWARSILSATGIDDTWPPSSHMASRPKQLRTLLGLPDAHGICVESCYASRAGVEIRYPYRDRRLIEFMLAVPTHQLYDRGVYKPILRQAMHGLLPERIRKREQPTLLYPLFVHGMTRAEAKTVDQLLNNPDGIWSQYVRADWLKQLVPDPQQPNLEAFILWLCVCCELWRLRFGTHLNLLANGSQSP
jgi:asparagine synthase (glutamine-hydrolysing)